MDVSQRIADPGLDFKAWKTHVLRAEGDVFFNHKAYDLIGRVRQHKADPHSVGINGA